MSIGPNMANYLNNFEMLSERTAFFYMFFMLFYQKSLKKRQCYDIIKKYVLEKEYREYKNGGEIIFTKRIVSKQVPFLA